MNKPFLRDAFLPVFTFVGFAVAQPLYNVLVGNLAFFTARNAGFPDFLIIILLLSLLLPLALSLGLHSCLRISRKLRHSLFYSLLLVLSYLIAYQLFQYFIQHTGPWLHGTAFLCALILVFGYAKSCLLRQYVNFLSIGAILFPVFFLYQSYFLQHASAKQMLAPEIAKPIPVVLILFDEFPLISLLDSTLKIDKTLYPNFHALSEQATWYRNASAVSTLTVIAAPSILTGLNPPDRSEYPAPNQVNYPRNLFVLMNDRYKLHAIETVSSLSPLKFSKNAMAADSAWQDLLILMADISIIYGHMIFPDTYKQYLPSIDGRWSNYGGLFELTLEDLQLADDAELGWRSQIVKRFTDSFYNPQPGFYFMHNWLPHVAYEYLPSGKVYGPVNFLPHGMEKKQWEDEWEALQSWQRHLLQVRYTDKVLGDILSHLKHSGLYDDSLIIVTADHGESFSLGSPPRRIDDNNLHEVLPVPFFVKFPEQSEGNINDHAATTLDIFPTIAEVIQMEVNWPLHGKALHPDMAATQNNRQAYKISGESFNFDIDYEELKRLVSRKINIFGDGDNDRIFNIGGKNQLLNKNLNELATEASTYTATVNNINAYHAINLNSLYLPAMVEGVINGSDDELSKTLPLAIALNGRIEAITYTYKGNSGFYDSFTAMLPETAFKEGENTLDILEINPSDEALRTLNINPTD